MTDEKAQEYIQALTRELEGYVRYGNEDSARQVRAELERMGVVAAPPARRAAKRASAKKRTEL